MKVYVSGPFFNPREREHMEILKSYLLTKYEDIYFPIDLQIPNAFDIPESEWAEKVYKKDMDELQKSDLMVVIYDGQYSDSGTAFKVGFAVAKGIKVHILVMKPEDVQSLMITNCTPFIYLFEDYIIDVLREVPLSNLSQT